MDRKPLRYSVARLASRCVSGKLCPAVTEARVHGQSTHTKAWQRIDAPDLFSEVVHAQLAFHLIAMPLMGDAVAGGFEAKTMQLFGCVKSSVHWSSERVGSQPGCRRQNSTGFWDAEGQDDNAHWLYSTQSMTVRYGIAKRASSVDSAHALRAVNQ